MLLNVTNTDFTYANEQATDITGVNVNFTVSELFGNTDGKVHTCLLKTLLSEYNSSITPDLLNTLMKTKMSSGLSDNTITVKLNGFDWTYDESHVINGAKIRFKTLNTDFGNSTMIDDYVSVTKDEADTAIGTGLPGILSLVKTKLSAEFQ